jgi:hypothetical protein
MRAGRLEGGIRCRLKPRSDKINRPLAIARSINGQPSPFGYSRKAEGCRCLCSDDDQFSCLGRSTRYGVEEGNLLNRKRREDCAHFRRVIYREDEAAADRSKLRGQALEVLGAEDARAVVVGRARIRRVEVEQRVRPIVPRDERGIGQALDRDAIEPIVDVLKQRL